MPKPSGPARKFSCHSRSPTIDPQIFGRAKSTAAGPKPQKTADDFVESAAPCSAVAPAHTRMRSPRNRTHTQPESTSPVSKTCPQLRPQNHMPPRLHFDVPMSYRARLVPFAALSRASKAALQRRERSRTTPSAAVGAPRWPKASAWEAGRPQRGARGRPRAARSFARGTRSQTSECSAIEIVQ